MKFFIDTANIDEIREAYALGILAGVTTNPSLVAKEKGVSFHDRLKETVLSRGGRPCSVAAALFVPFLPSGGDGGLSTSLDGLSAGCIFLQYLRFSLYISQLNVLSGDTELWRPSQPFNGLGGPLPALRRRHLLFPFPPCSFFLSFPLSLLVFRFGRPNHLDLGPVRLGTS